MTTIYVLTMIIYGTTRGGNSAITTQEYNNSGTCEDAKLTFLETMQGTYTGHKAFCKAK